MLLKSLRLQLLDKVTLAYLDTVLLQLRICIEGKQLKLLQ